MFGYHGLDTYAYINKPACVGVRTLSKYIRLPTQAYVHRLTHHSVSFYVEGVVLVYLGFVS